MTFTVFTPVFNRRHLIPRVWQSLRAQTDIDFEWIVVDDGSADGVCDLLAEYQAQATFPVIIHRQPNGGKHVAWNWAVTRARGELFVPADSDDEFLPQALARFRLLWNAIPSCCRDRYSGVNVLCQDQEGSLVGDRFPADVMTSNNLELFYRFKVRGEKWGCVRTELLRQRLFPEIAGRGCFPLEWVFFWLARRYQVLCVNEVLRVYYLNQSDSITACYGRKLAQSAEVLYCAISWNLGTNIDLLLKWASPARIARHFLGWWRIGFLARKSVRSMIGELERPAAKCLACLMLPLGWCVYLATYRRCRSAA